MSFVSLGAGGDADLYAVCAAQDGNIHDGIEPLLALIHSDDIDRYFDVREASKRTMSLFHAEFRILHPENGERRVELRALPESDSDGCVCWHSCLMDVSAKKPIACELKQSESCASDLMSAEWELRTLLDNTPDTIARYDKDCRRTYVNRAFSGMVKGGATALLGATPSQCPGGLHAAIYESKINEVFEQGRAVEFELKWTDRNEQEMCSHIRLTPERDATGQVVSALAVGRDITELNVYRYKIHQMAFYDELTALPNRALFKDRLHQMIIDAAWHGQQAGVMLLDLDQFKTVNDTLGHPAGDQLLRQAAKRIAGCMRAYDCVARFGGDEFAILLPKIRTAEDLGRIACKILNTFDEPFTLEGHEVFSSTSIGIAVYPQDGRHADELVRLADTAMYGAKRTGRNNFRFYFKELTVFSNEKLALESELRRALERQELELYYQPKILLEGGSLIGSEALLRWNNPRRGLVPPDQFIRIAEDSGLIVEIGAWVLMDACRTACAWNGPDKPLHKVAINLSVRQFQASNLLETVREALTYTGCQPQWIELEITESLLLDEDGEVLATLNAFQSLGISIAIDDFGTGYSALSYLARFPVNILKIDRSFINAITVERYRAELVKAVISIARCLGQQVVAEGVETVEQAAFLRAHGCQMAQGYLYSKPVTKAVFESLLLSFAQAH